MPAKLFYTGPSLGTLHEEYAKKSRIAWYPEFTVLDLGEVHPGAPMRWKLGGLTMRSTFAVVNPGRELTWTGRFLGYKAVDQHLLEPAGNGRTTSRSGSRWPAPCSPSCTARANCKPAINGGSPP
jgi:hypothetical protein